MRLTDGTGVLELGAELGRGGEGVVYAVPHDPALAAKVYHTVADDERADKLVHMVELYARVPELAQNVAWPLRILRDDEGSVRGFVMLRLDAPRPVHDLYSPEQRKRLFADMTWDGLIRAAAQCASVFELLHRHGVVVGDVNERNVLFDAQGRLHLVDADSFQVADGARVFRTGVGVVDYTPPELQGADFRGLVRTPNHDRFGLAVLLFKLVFMGRHPYSGGENGDLAGALAAFDYDYQKVASRLRHLVPLAAVGGELQRLFALAFGEDGAAQERPAPAQWHRQLATFADSLESCPVESVHRVPRGLPRCPWCQIEAALYYAYFVRAAGDQHVSTWTPRDAELASLRAALAQTHPSPDPTYYPAPDGVAQALALAQQVVAHPPPPDATAWYVRVLAGLVGLGGGARLAMQGDMTAKAMLGVGVAGWLSTYVLKRQLQRPWQRRVDRLKALAEEVAHAADAWRAEAYRFRNRDRQLLAAFHDLVAQHEGVMVYRTGEIERLTRDVVGAQVRPLLEKMALDTLDLPPQVNADRKRALMIRGFLTAADIEREALQGVPAMTVPVIDALVQWRQALEVQLGGRRRTQARADQLAAVDGNCQVMQETLESQLADLVDKRAQMTAEAEAFLVRLYEHQMQVLEQLGREAAQMWRVARHGH